MVATAADVVARELPREAAETGNLYLKEPEVVRRLTELLAKAQADGGARPA